MLKELFDAINDQAVEANGVKVLQVAAEPSHKYYLCTPDQAPRLVEAAPKPREHQALSIEAIVRMVEDANANEPHSNYPEVWYSSKQIVAFLNGETRRDKVTLALNYSPPLLDLLSLEKNQTPYTTANFRKFLRVNLAGCLSRAANLVGLIERVKFSSSSEQVEQVRHGSTSIGKKLEQSLTGTDVLPEFVEIDVPIFSGEFGYLRGVVTCALEPEAATQSFKLIPLPGQLTQRIREAEAVIREKLDDLIPDLVPLLHGTP